MAKKKPINFVHLHGHSYYSLLDGVTKPEEAVEKAAILGMPAIALTDHGNCHGCADLFFECMKYIKMKDDEWKAVNEKRLSDGKKPMVSRPKPIMGMEAYFTPGMRFPPTDRSSPSARNCHMVVLARNNEGWSNLCRMHYISWKEGHHYRPRIDTDLLKKYGKGIIILSACIAGYPQQELLAWIGLGDAKRYENAKRHVLQMKELTDNHYWLEVQDTRVDEITLSNTVVVQKPQLAIAEAMKKLAADTDVKIVLTNDFHFLNREDRHAQAACNRIGEKNPDKYDVYNQNWMKSAEEMSELFFDNPEWMEESLKIAGLCDVNIKSSEYVMPIFPTPKEYEGKSEIELLTLLAKQGLEERYPAGHPRRDAAIAQLEYELDVIIKMKFSGYFLIVWDIYRRAHELKIACGLGRGSAAGSIVAYCLGITQLCPLEYDLLFERFLNPDRISMPDIDMDFDAARRDELILYAREKYGQENVANIISYQTMKSKAVIRDVARTYNYDLGTVDKIAKSIPVKFGKPDDLRTAFSSENMKGYLRDPLMRTIYEDALKIENNPKSRGTHASGILITPCPCYEYIPMEWDKEKKVYMTSFKDTTCSGLGLLKLDFLGVKSITIYKNCKEDLKKCLGIEIIDSKIPFNDSRVWQMLAQGDTHGVFQMEAGGFQRFCRDLSPDSVNDLVAMVALYRPGPMGMGTHTSYIERKAGREPVSYLPGCEEVLKTTYGLMFYQETVMQVSRILCGFTRGESDNLRKAIGKKDARRMAEIEKKWKEGAEKVGLLKTEQERNDLWKGIAGFGEYGFNRSVLKGTKVSTTNGIKSIEQLKPYSDKVLTVDQNGDIVPTDIVGLYDHGELECFEVIFDDCSSVTCSANHKFSTPLGMQPLHRIMSEGMGIYACEAGWVERTVRTDIQDQCGIRHTQEVLCNLPESWSAKKVGRIYGTMWSGPSSEEGVLQSSLLMSRMYTHQERAYQRANDQDLSSSPNFRGSIKGCQAHGSTPRNNPIQERETCELATQQSRETCDMHSQSHSGPKEIKARGLHDEVPRATWVQKACTDTLWTNPEGSRFCKQQYLGGSRRSMALHGHAWTTCKVQNQGRNSEQGSTPQEGLPNKDRNRGIPFTRAYKIPRHSGSSSIQDCPDGTRNLVLRKVVQCRWVGQGHTYDIKVAHPSHAFFLANGVLTSNSHAAVYGVFSYWTAYLKANFPQYYLKAMLNDRRENKTRMAQYVNVCRDMGLAIEPPNVNKSEEGFVVEGDKIIFGLDAIKGVSPTSARSIVHARTKGAPFKNLQDFCNRVAKGVESNVIKGLINAGAFSELFKSKDHALNILPKCIELGHEFKAASGQGAFMELAGEAENPPTTKDFVNGNEEKQLGYEAEALGFYLTDTPLKFRERILRPFFEEGKIKHLSDIPEVANTDSKKGIFVGVMTEIKQKMSKRREPYWRFQLQEEISVETTAFSSAQTDMETIGNGDVVIILGRAEYEGGDIDEEQVEEERLGLLVDSISKLEAETDVIAMIKKAEAAEEIRIRKAEGKWRSYQGNQSSSHPTGGQSGSRTSRNSTRG
jgi:DNA-directed DNA polymerase III PolC